MTCFVLNDIFSFMSLTWEAEVRLRSNEGQSIPGRKILIIAPHADDEVLGCGGLIAKQTARGDEVHLVIAAVGGNRQRHLASAPSIEERWSEALVAADILGISKVVALYEGYDMRMDTVPKVELVTKIDAILDSAAFSEIYLPCSSHNHDHEVVLHASLAALRPAAHAYSPDLIAQYEYYYGWTQPPTQGGKMYVDITFDLEVKARAMEAYGSQVRQGSHPASLEAIRTLAAMRGLEAGFKYAELFYVLKFIKP